MTVLESGLDVAALRAHFPSLRSGIAHFDGPGGTQTPLPVAEAIAATLTGPLSNLGDDLLPSEVAATTTVARFRRAGADLTGADPAGIVHGRSATQLAYDFAKHLSVDWGLGDEIVVSRLDHDSNIRPWLQAAQAAGATVRWLEFDPDTAEIPLQNVDDVLSDRTRLVAVTAASNLLGSKPAVAQIAERVHAAGGLLWVDGVHHAAHCGVDIDALGADFYVASAYKFFGPHCSVLAADPALLQTIRPAKLLPSTNAVPERFEFGTLPFELLAGVTAAVDFLAAAGSAARPEGTRRQQVLAGMAVIDARETVLRQRIEDGLAEFGDAIVMHSRAGRRTPTLFMTFPGRSAAEVSAALAQRQVLAPAGSFYAHEAFQVLRAAGRTDDEAGLRVGLAAYTSDEDVQRLLDGLAGILR